LDAQCDKLATAVGQTKLTTHATIHMPWEKTDKKSAQSSESTPIFAYTRISFQHNPG